MKNRSPANHWSVKWIGLGCCVWILVAVVTFGWAQEGGVPPEGLLNAQKLPLPAADERKAGQKKIRETFAADFKQARTPIQKWNLAVKIGTVASETKDDPESELALAQEAIELYTGVGDVLSAFRLVDELAMTFEIDPIAQKVDLFKRAGKEAKAIALKRMLALVGLKLAGDAAGAENYAAAKEVATLSVGLAKPSRDASVIKRANEQLGRYSDLLKQWELVVAARKKLEADENLPDENLIVGRYLCLTRQDWDAGLPHLVLSSGLELKAIAAKDIATTTEVESMADTADAWWKITEDKKDAEKKEIFPRVAHWYELALPNLAGLAKVTAEKRLETAYEVMSGRNFKKITSEVPNGIRSEGTVDCEEKAHPANLAPTFDFKRSWMVSFEFSPPHLGGGWHMVLFWGDGRAGHDPLWFRQDGPYLHCIVEDVVGERGQGITAILKQEQVGKWVNVKLVHDTISQELELYIDHRLVRKDALAITPQVDQAMNIVLGGTNDYTGQRFTGKVRNVWMGNIK